jgi:hypothetical protein
VNPVVRTTLVLVALGAVASGCVLGGGGTGDGPEVPGRVSPAPLVQPLVGGTDSIDGAHRVPGTGVLAEAVVVDVPLTGLLDAPPAWVVGASTDEATWWVVVDGEGGVLGLRVPDDGSGWEVAPVEPSRLPAGAPPVLVTVNPLVLVSPPAGAAPLAPALPLLPSGTAVVLTDGRVRLGDGVDAPVLDLAAPPDARMAVDPVTGALAVPASATDRYPHGVLGDGVEPSAVVVIDAEGRTRTVVAADDEVFEGLGPAWVDLGGDGEAELAMVASRPDDGSRVVVVDADGRRIEGPPVGEARRWIHLVGAASLGPDRAVELVAVRTPHRSGTVEWYREADGRLEVVAALDGYRSHQIGSRNLDQALLTDGTGDRRADVIVPTADRRSLAVLARTDRAPGAEEVARLDLPGDLVSNVAAVGRIDRPLVLAAADAATLRIWLAAPGQRDAG